MLAWSSRAPRADRVAPFETAGRPGRTAVLLLHGFGCSPWTMRGLGRRLAAEGRACYAPLLPGHGLGAAEFDRVRHEEWLDAAEAAFDHLAERHPRVAVVGFSMGGTLGLHLAAARPVAALATLAAPLRLPLGILAVMAGRLLPSLPVLFDVADGRARHARAQGVQTALAPRAVRELLRLLDRVRPGLARVRCPLLVAQSRGDHTVWPGNARAILEAVASERRRLVWVPRAWHVLPVDHGHRALEAELARFLDDVGADPGSGNES